MFPTPIYSLEKTLNSPYFFVHPAKPQPNTNPNPTMSQQGPPPVADTPTTTTTITTPDLPPTIITLPTIHLRPIHPSDAPALQRVANSPAVSKYMTYAFPAPYTLQDAQNWIAFASVFKIDNVIPSLAIIDSATGEFLGGMGVKPPRGDVEAHVLEVAYWLGEGSWGKGVATQALRAYVGWLFETFPKVERLEAVVFEGNGGSVKVLERVGFVLEGRRRKAAVKHGVVMDVLIFGLLKEEWEVLN